MYRLFFCGRSVPENDIFLVTKSLHKCYNTSKVVWGDHGTDGSEKKQTKKTQRRNPDSCGGCGGNG